MAQAMGGVIFVLAVTVAHTHDHTGNADGIPLSLRVLIHQRKQIFTAPASFNGHGVVCVASRRVFLQPVRRRN
jgi:hypothetical protein